MLPMISEDCDYLDMIGWRIIRFVWMCQYKHSHTDYDEFMLFTDLDVLWFVYQSSYKMVK